LILDLSEKLSDTEFAVAEIAVMSGFTRPQIANPGNIANNPIKNPFLIIYFKGLIRTLLASIAALHAAVNVPSFRIGFSHVVPVKMPSILNRQPTNCQM
jgi:hypothetical protein